MQYLSECSCFGYVPEDRFRFQFGPSGTMLPYAALIFCSIISVHLASSVTVYPYKVMYVDASSWANMSAGSTNVEYYMPTTLLEWPMRRNLRTFKRHSLLRQLLLLHVHLRRLRVLRQRHVRHGHRHGPHCAEDGGRKGSSHGQQVDLQRCRYTTV